MRKFWSEDIGEVTMNFLMMVSLNVDYVFYRLDHLNSSIFILFV